MRTWSVLLGLVLLLTACTSDPAPSPPTRHTPAPRPPDRDEHAVLATLAALDPCALVDLPEDRRTKPLAPHQCLITDLHGNQDTIITFTRRSPLDNRFAGRVEELGGAKVESVLHAVPTPHCWLEVPASFEYAVRVRGYGYEAADECTAIEGYATSVATRLATPDKYRQDRPELAKDACSLLAGAVADLGEQATGLEPDADSVDRCGLDAGSLGRSSLSIEVGSGPDAELTPWTSVHGKQVYFDAEQCQGAWRQAPVGADHLTVTVDLPCAKSDGRSKRLVAALMARLGEPVAKAAPTRLTYRIDEPDRPVAGACVDYPGADCEPAQPGPVPSGAGPATDAAAADPYVACAAAAEAVHAQFAELRPVVAERHCSFVEPSHLVQLDLSVETGTGGQTEPLASRRQLTVAGHPALYREVRSDGEHYPVRSLCVDSGHDTRFWCLSATFRPARGTIGFTADTGGAARLAPVMTAIAAKYLA